MASEREAGGQEAGFGGEGLGLGKIQTRGVECLGDQGNILGLEKDQLIDGERMRAEAE